jgi:hypothetical protein
MPETVTCPLDGQTLTLDVLEQGEDGACFYVAVAERGTAYQHIRDSHPQHWQQMCEQQRAANANPSVTFMPRRVDGCFLQPGQDVGDLP